MPEAISSFTPLPPRFFDLRRAMASPSGVEPGASAMAPSWTPVVFWASKPGSVGMIAESGMSTGGGGAGAVVVVVVSSSLAGFLFLSVLAGLVVVGAGAAEVGVWVPADDAGGAVVCVVAGRVVVVVWAAGAVVGGVVAAGAVVVVVALGSVTTIWPHIPTGWLLAPRSPCRSQ